MAFARVTVCVCVGGGGGAIKQGGAPLSGEGGGASAPNAPHIVNMRAFCKQDN